MNLAEKIRKARESVVEVGGHKLTIRRPTDAEMARGVTPFGLVHDFVVGWDLTEVDLVPGGNPVPAEFSREAWTEYVDDHPDLWQPVSDAVRTAYAAHAEKRADAEKN